MRGRRSLAVLALTAPLALTGLATAPSALASGSFSSPTPAEGAVLGSSSFTVKAAVAGGSNDVTLTVSGQDGSGAALCTVKSSSRGGPLSGAQTLSLSFPSSACPTSRNARWTATLTGDASGTRSFATNAAPSTPANFAADGDGARDVAFSWSKGSEPDLIGYALSDSSGVIDGDIGFDHCNGSLCTYALYYPSDNPGTHSYSLVARRASAGCSGCGSEVQSGQATASATLVEPPPPPPPSPTPTPTPTGGTGGTTTTGGTTGATTGSGGTTSGGTTGGAPGGTTGGTTSGTTGTSVQPAPKPTLPTLPKNLAAARRAFALSFNAFSPSLGIPKLPPLPAAFAPTISPNAPLPMGTYSPTLPYKAQQQTVEKTSVVSRVTGGVVDTDTATLAQALAVALILLLMAAHLRRFVAVRDDS